MAHKNHQPVHKTLNGFTIIELSITMAFIAALLIFVAIVTTNALAIYQKGTVIKAINSVGRGLIDDFSSSINSAPILNVESACMKLKFASSPASTAAVNRCNGDKAFSGYVYNTRVDSGKQLYGVFCTGSYSYIWNSPYAYQTGKTISLKYLDQSDNTKTKSANDLKLARIHDPNRRVCTATMDLQNYTSRLTGSGNFELDITKYADSDRKLNIEEPQTNLLASSDADLRLYELVIFPYSSNEASGRAFFSGTFILATERGGINVKNSGDYCQSTGSSNISNLGNEFNYCAINKFNFAARTAGE